MQEAESPNWLKGALIIAIAVACAILLGFGFHRYNYPHGLRAGKLTTFMGLLAGYAQQHGGWFPNGGPTPLASLQQLYPDYCAEGLAGMSGNEKQTLQYLKDGKTIDEIVSSWVYHPGFRNDDDPEIAIIWEREAGMFINGSRADGHAVGFADGSYDQIVSKDWPTFLQHQEELRKKTLARRAR